MKESRILKITSHLALITFISILILAIFTISLKENVYYKEERFV